MSTIPDDLAVWRRLQDAGQAHPWPQALRLLTDGEQPGSLELLRGISLSEALTDEYGQWSQEDYTALVEPCRAHGVAISADDPDDLLEPEVSPTPAQHHAACHQELLGGS